MFSFLIYFKINFTYFKILNFFTNKKKKEIFVNVFGKIVYTYIYIYTKVRKNGK